MRKLLILYAFFFSFPFSGTRTKLQISKRALLHRLRIELLEIFLRLPVFPVLQNELIQLVPVDVVEALDHEPLFEEVLELLVENEVLVVELEMNDETKVTGMQLSFSFLTGFPAICTRCSAL